MKFEVNTSSYSCSILLQEVISYCCNIPKGKDMYCTQYISLPFGIFIYCLWQCIISGHSCLQGFVTSKHFRGIIGTNSLNMVGILSAWRKYEMILDKVSGMKSGVCRQVQCREILNAGRIVSQLSLSAVHRLLKEGKGTRIVLKDLYYVFSFERMHDLHLGMMKRSNTVLQPTIL